MYLMLLAPSSSSSSSMGCGISKFEQEVITGTTYESNDKLINHRDQDHVDRHHPISSTSKLEDYGRNNEDNIDDYRARDGHRIYTSSNTKEEVESMQEREVKGCRNSNDFDGTKEKDRLLEKKLLVDNKQNGINNSMGEVEEDRQKDYEEEEEKQLYDREDSLCFPGSPSFRDYCNLDDECHSKDNCKKEDKTNESQLTLEGPPDGDEPSGAGAGAGAGAQQILLKKASKVRRFRDAMSSRSRRQGRKTTLKVYSNNKAPKKPVGKAA
ncbi:uncharacterized protein LOC125424268 [Ziziphus jujuba]|uniref:Uncharacterized protein LOC125424268 n=1 Tax=Ziziphus jujuba TaxID=326968 RepID=A0ABM3IWU8_ZIZJJ|nr:uncharacterized protein LOC125424268 [Ziziphus jujuba]